MAALAKHGAICVGRTARGCFVSRACFPAALHSRWVRRVGCCSISPTASKSLMYSGFPRDLLATLVCPTDRGRLSISSSAARVVKGSLSCETCGRSYQIADGIVDLFDDGLLDTESENEHARRDE